MMGKLRVGRKAGRDLRPADSPSSAPAASREMIFKAGRATYSSRFYENPLGHKICVAG